MKERPFLRREAAGLLGLLSVVLLNTAGKGLLAGLPSPWDVAALFLWLFPLMLWCAVSVVRHADCLAHLLGEPYGTLILTLSAVTMEVALIASAMLTGAADPLLARDTMLAVLMIVLNGLIGLSLVIGAVRHGEQEFNISGASAYLSVIATLSVLTLVLPAFTVSTRLDTYTPHQMLFFSIAALLLYGVFLAVQTHRHRGFFQEPAHRGSSGHAPVTQSIAHHALMLVLTLLPVVLLAETLSVLIEDGTKLLHLPAAFGGVLIAMLVLTAEGLSAIAAARADRLQRSVNISLGSALSTIGLTVPAVMLISVVTGQPVTLGLAPEFMALLVLTLFVSLLTFGTGRTNVLLGAVHLILFGSYVTLLFEP